MLNNFDAVLCTAGEKESVLLENLLFSLNMSLPLFVVMGLGCVLTHKGFFTEDYVAHTTNLVYYILLPGKMFLDIATSDFGAAFDTRYVAVAVGGVVLQFALAWAAGWLLCPDRSKQSAFSHAAYRGNFVYLGTALLQNIYGVSHVPSATLILALVIPLYNIQGVVLMTVKERQGRFRLSTVLLNVLKNPMILAVLAAIPFAYFKIQLPFVVSESLGYFQAATNTMALLVVGGSIRLSALKSDMPLLLRLSGVKLLLMPAIWAAMGIAAGLPAEQLVTLIIVGAMPAAVNVYIITDKMGGDGALACSAVVVTHLVSLFTMTGIVFAMRTAGLI